MYRSWVYFREAKLDGNLKLELGEYPYILDNDVIKPVKKVKEKELSKKEQLNKYGYWIEDEFYDGCCVQVIDKEKSLVKFIGLLACGRWCRKWIKGKYKFYTYLTIGYKNGFYIDLKIEDKWMPTKEGNLVEGSGEFVEVDKIAKYGYIIVDSCKIK